MEFLSSIFDFEKQLAFYSAYHHNWVNKIIHVIFVPTIMSTVLVWLSNYWVVDGSISLAHIVAAIYGLYYIVLEKTAGLLYAPVLGAMTYGASQLLKTYPSTANTYALYVHIFSWISQFIGHGVFEGRAPALLDNLVQAFLLAPFFVWLEVLFFLGYQPKLKEKLEKKTLKAIAEWKKSKEKKN